VITPERRILIVNADDFGLSPGINRGILHAHEHGIVTSTSLMVRWPAAAEAADAARAHPRLSFGLHVDLGEWAYRNGAWESLYGVLPPEAAGDADAVSAEVARQVAAFRELLGRDPTHLDSHQHVHRSEPARSALLTWAAKLNVPLRHFDPRVRYCGDFYGQSGKGEPYPLGISLEHLLATLRALPPGVTELCCHPGGCEDYVSQYRAERPAEVTALCDPAIRQMLSDAAIELASFESLR
jgi:predicted glycoside hydrolase/deacetylase ChbG (UPF0249 family)